MVKVEIDDAVRSFALVYSQQVMATCADVEEKLAELGTFVADNNDWNDKSAITEYIDLLIADYPKVLTLEPIEWKQYIDKYNEVLKREPDMLTTEVAYTKTKKKVLKGKLYERIIICLQYAKARVILGEIHQQMGLKTCVYCNTIPTMSKNGEVFYQMDHYLPQSLYPFLGTCFYNLQPSCDVCNDHKKTQDCDFGLYVNSEQHKELSPFRFVPKIESLDGPYPRCEEILFRGKGANVTKESKAHEEMFHINNLYAGYKDEVSALYADSYKMNPTMIAVNAECWGIPATKKDVLAYMSGHLSLEEKDIHKKTLTKLKQDTIKQLKEGGVL
ncbi:HNH endonuclease [Segatella copri]|uniref:HNH endonuclease n=1 Tax=Segatella copri TaxID=165179 RepID=A0A3E5DS85_9BACT|nr:hypothetical protein [Segatella copri]RGN79530.1 hypothetical protein DXB41_13680 [Segatella copri]RGS11256.1 hypothetical protein DWY11_14390 [Segatella copri]